MNQYSLIFRATYSLMCRELEATDLTTKEVAAVFPEEGGNALLLLLNEGKVKMDGNTIILVR